MSSQTTDKGGPPTDAHIAPVSTPVRGAVTSGRAGSVVDPAAPAAGERRAPGGSSSQVAGAGEPTGSHGWVWVVVVCLLAGGAIGGWFLWSKHKASQANAASQPAPRPTPVVATPAVKRNFDVYLQALGNVAAYNTVTIRSRVDGQLMEVHFTEGQTVHAKDLLFHIDPRPFQVQLTQAQGQLARDRASLNNAQLDLQRYQAAREAITGQQIDTAAAAVAQFEGAIKTDEGAIESAQLQISYCDIASPIEGRIGLRMVDQGNMVHAGDATGLAVITQVQPIAVLFSIRQDDLPAVLAKLNAGQKPVVQVYDRAFANKLAEGRLETVDNEIDPTTGTARYKAAFANDPLILFPSQFVNVKLLIDTKRDVIAVPAAAIQRGPTDTFVYVVKEDRTVEMRPVTPGITQEETTLVDKGLEEGEMVVTDGVDKLHEGSMVSVRQPGASAEDGTMPADGSQPGTRGGRSGAGSRGGRGGRRGGSAASNPSGGAPTAGGSAARGGS